MTSTVSARGADRILNKLRIMRENKQFYEAHQNYRTIYYRYQSANRYQELQSLLFEGANWFLDMKEYNSGADLASLFIDSLSKDPQIAEVLETQEGRRDVSKKVGLLFSKIPEKSPERMHYTILALKLEPNHFDIPQIHYHLAVVLWQEKNFVEARYHFLHSSPEAGRDCATLLIEYQISRGFTSEVDVFISQFILQLLCARTALRGQTQVLPKGNRRNDLDNPRSESNNPRSESNNPRSESNNPRNDLKLDNVVIVSTQQALANETLQSYTANHPQIRKPCPPFMYPLVNFVWLLLLAIEGAKSSQFRLLCELYATALSRDPEYKRYLTRIGELYFGIKPPARNRAMGGILGNLLQSLMDDDDDDESEVGDRPTQVKSPPATRMNQVDDDLD